MISTFSKYFAAFLAASLVAAVLLAIPLGWRTGTSGSTLSGSALQVDTCAAPTCKAMTTYICNIGDGDNMDYCDTDDCP